MYISLLWKIYIISTVLYIYMCCYVKTYNNLQTVVYDYIIISAVDDLTLNMRAMNLVANDK